MPLMLGVGAAAGAKRFPSVSYGFDCEMWFSKEGWTPHYAEHVLDPTDQKEKLVMADPHTQRKAFVYDLVKQEVEWEYQFNEPGTGEVRNPHTARMLMEDVADLGSAGDIYCCSPDQKVVVIDRDTKTIKKTITMPFTPKFLHEAIVSHDKLHLIVTDYQWGNDNQHGVVKVKLSDASEVWARVDFVCPAKVSLIKGYGLQHNPSYGGEYLVCCNDQNGLVAEIKDSDGTIVWACPSSQDGEGMMLAAPHHAIRLGRVEWAGDMTVVGTESGGGIVGLAFGRFPYFCIGNKVGKTHDGAHQYHATALGLSEVTHVFETLHGRIGFIDWSGRNRSNVAVINKFPERQQGHFRLTRNKSTTNTYDFNEYLPIDDWDEVYVTVMNTGATNGLTYRILGCLNPLADYTNHPEMWVEEKAATNVGPGSSDQHMISRPYSFIRIDYKSQVADAPTTLDCYVTFRRGGH